MEDIREPVAWRRPRAKVYDYNQQFGGTYYQPMLEYINSKERQGVFFSRPSERIRFPDANELITKKTECASDYTGSPSIDKFLVQAYAQQIKEKNMATVKTKTKMLKGMTAMRDPSHTAKDNQQTHFSDIRLLKGEVPGRRQINHYLGELAAYKVSADWQKYCTTEHMKDVATGLYDCDNSCYGQGGTPSNQQFYDEKIIKSAVNAIKFKNPERTIPVV